MGTNFIRYDPKQPYLLPPNPSDWLPSGHLAYFIRDTFEVINLNKFYEKYEGDGRRNQPYHPRMLIQVLVYGYCTGVFSSRKIAKKIEEDVAFRVLAGDNRPHHTTLCKFREAHLEDFKEVFKQVLQIAKEAKLYKLGVVAIDGSKLKASASRHKAMSYERMKSSEDKLQKEITEITRRARGDDRSLFLDSKSSMKRQNLMLQNPPDYDNRA
jgi:transposase